MTSAYRIWSVLDKRKIAAAVMFVMILFLLETCLFRESYYSVATHTGYIQLVANSMPLHILLHLFAVGGSLLMAVCYVYNSLISSAAIRWIHFMVFVFIVFVEYGYQSTLSRYSDAGDIEPFLLITDMKMQLSNARLYINWAAVWPCLAYGVMLLFGASKKRFGLVRLTAVFAAMLCFYFVMSRYVVLYNLHLKYPVASLNASFRTIGDYIGDPSFFAYSVARDEVDPFPPRGRPANNVIFIVDESIRGDHLSLNGYRRSTTPHLVELAARGTLTNWGVAAAGATCSGPSNLLLLTGLKVQDLPDGVSTMRKMPTIFQFAKAAGYKTHYFDGQMNMFWNAKGADVKYIDEWWNLNRLLAVNSDPREVDFTIAATIKGLANESRGNFVWVNKAGCHMPYYERFPESEVKWSPSWNGGGWGARREIEIRNAYDNAIRYNLERFFRSLSPDYRAPDDTIIVYTSDHGQALFEGGTRVPQCGTSKPEAMVPLFVLRNETASADTKYRASHSNLFATLLDLMNVPETARKYKYNVSLFKARESDSEPRYYNDMSLARTGRTSSFD